MEQITYERFLELYNKGLKKLMEKINVDFDVVRQLHKENDLEALLIKINKGTGIDEIIYNICQLKRYLLIKEEVIECPKDYIFYYTKEKGQISYKNIIERDYYAQLYSISTNKENIC